MKIRWFEWKHPCFQNGKRMTAQSQGNYGGPDARRNAQQRSGRKSLCAVRLTFHRRDRGSRLTATDGYGEKRYEFSRQPLGRYFQLVKQRLAPPVLSSQFKPRPIYHGLPPQISARREQL